LTLSTGTTVRWIGKREIDAKLLAAAPRILEQNRAMVTEMLEMVKVEILPGTPEGPGHFGYHLRDTYRIEVSSQGVKTTGKLKAAVQGYWREFGTQGRFKGRGRAAGRLQAVRIMTGAVLAGGGEKAGLFATKALSQARRLIRFYYGKAQWWRP